MFNQLEQFSGKPVIGGKDCEAVTKTPKDGETFEIGQGIKVKALYTPCHTQDSICYLMEDGTDRAVFTGDTLFIGGMRDRGFGSLIERLSNRQDAGGSSKGRRQRCIKR